MLFYFPLSLLALLSPSEQTQQHLRHLYMSEALGGLNIHNTKPLFIICCAQEFYLCKQKKRHEENVKAYVRTTASATARTDVAQIEPEEVACLRRLTILEGFEPVTSQSRVWPDTANSIDAEFSFSLAGQGVTSSGKREHIAKVARKNLPFDSSTRIKPANAFRKRGQPMMEF
ncbi:Transmembrane protein 106A [Dissostichus eleginoides]|uniref:Transmembrane protein 106A n=1 Tax=Dissostichus eleginoides TaxID=100907 RepID=A0AAD9C5L4_DISEL|nr:Transmembrane protein 106A [Dissostichus eleginoides]